MALTRQHIGGCFGSGCWLWKHEECLGRRDGTFEERFLHNCLKSAVACQFFELLLELLDDSWAFHVLLWLPGVPAMGEVFPLDKITGDLVDYALVEDGFHSVFVRF